MKLTWPFRARPGADWERSRQRWRTARPDAALTWGHEVSGDAFIARVAAHGGFDGTPRVLEVGPGYGRLLASLLAAGYAFASYTGADLSPANVAALRERFQDPRCRFVVADAERADLPGRPFDLVISSLTFKHLHPSFEALLRNLRRQLAPDALVVFDLLGEGNEPWADHIYGNGGAFEAENPTTFIRSYTPDEARTLVEAAGLRVAAFDEVEHMPGRVRMLVIARPAAR